MYLRWPHPTCPIRQLIGSDRVGVFCSVEVDRRLSGPEAREQPRLCFRGIQFSIRCIFIIAHFHMKNTAQYISTGEVMLCVCSYDFWILLFTLPAAVLGCP